MPPAMSELAPPPTLAPIRGCSEEELAGVFDLAVIGGGIYGVASLLEASRRGCRAILLEANDFGGGVSWSSHRIIHGGLRYLQSLDIARFRESVRERRWFMDTFPHHIEPLGCLVPLTGRGTRRPSLFAGAAAMNNSLNTLFGGSSPRLAGARVGKAQRLAQAGPDLHLAGVRGVGLWQDGLMVSSERLLVCLLRLACGLGGRAVRGVRVVGVEPGETIRLACERGEGEGLAVHARRVINCAGPASGELASMLGGSHATLFEPLRAFNVLLKVEPRLTEAVALDVPSLGGRMLFVVPGPAGLAIGTWEEPADGHATPTRSSVDALLDAAGEVLRRSDLGFDRVTAVWSGLLPRAAGGELSPSDRPVVVDHGAVGGIPGAFSVSGVKYTTARLVAERVVRRAFPDAGPPIPIGSVADPVLEAPCFISPPDPAAAERAARRIMQEEAALSVDDVCRRRTTWYASPDRLRAVAPAIGAAFGLAPDAAMADVEASLGAAQSVRDG